VQASVVSAISADMLVSPIAEVTIFAPSDDAFAAAAEAFGGELPDGQDVIASVCDACVSVETNTSIP